MAHVLSTLNRYVYLFLFIFFSIIGETPQSYGQNESVDSSIHSASISTGAALTNNPQSSQLMNSRNHENVLNVFNAMSFPSAESSNQQTETSSTIVEESSRSVWRSIGNMLISLAFVIMIGLGIAWFMRRFVVRDTALGGGKINMLASYTLSQKSKVYLLRVGSQTFLVGEGANELNMLSEVNLSSPNINEEEFLAATGTDMNSDGGNSGGFESKLNQWQNALKSKDMGSEVNTSLLLLGGLAQRLRNKREGQQMSMRRGIQCIERFTCAIHARHLIVFGLYVLWITGNSWGQEIPIVSSVGRGEEPSPDDLSITLQILFLLTVLTLLPSILLMTTAFIRISIVLGLLRRAIGTQQTPSNQIIIGLSLFMTFFIMTPVLEDIYESAVKPYYSDEIYPLEPGDVDPYGNVVQEGEKVLKFQVMLMRASLPIREFMWLQIGTKGANDVGMFMSMARMEKPGGPNDVPMQVLIPAFMISELKKAFMMGFMIFIPFLILDIVTSSVLISMGMFQLPPAFISLPFKILLFVLVDGWSVLLKALGDSFYQNMVI